MELLWIALLGIGVIGILVLITAYICFRMAFYVPERNKKIVRQTAILSTAFKVLFFPTD